MGRLVMLTGVFALLAVAVAALGALVDRRHDLDQRDWSAPDRA
ncbi:hypothetical protein ACQP1G_14245 [Nocardia sp. CA-107356]